MSFKDVNYINRIQSRLVNFKKNPRDYNFRCFYCGDSKKNTKKSRAYLYPDKDSHVYHCHNCGKHTNFRGFLKDFDHSLYLEYLMDFYGDKASYYVAKDEKKQAPDLSILKSLKSIADLEDHPAKKYVEKRMIPKKFHSTLYYAPKFKHWVNTIIPDKFKLEVDTPRLVIPFIKDNKLIAFQGRSFDPKEEIKYITISLGDEKIFGYDTTDFSKTYYVLEGPIDSMFVPNSIAKGDSNLTGIPNKDNAVLVFDNEPRNETICRKMQRAIDTGYSIVIWPHSADKKEDCNDLVLRGLNPLDIITKNTFNGLKAKVEFNRWKK